MKNHRRVYLRKKGDKIIFECKSRGKTKYIWTIPKPYDTFLKNLCKSSYFTKDKAEKIMTILLSSDYKDYKGEKESSEVRIMNIGRNQEKDENKEVFN